MRENRALWGMRLCSCGIGGAWNAWRWLPLMLLLVLYLLPAFAPPARAHAVLLRSDPAERAVLRSAPSQIRLWFTERLNASFSTAYIVDGANQTVVEGRFSHLIPESSNLLLGSLFLLRSISSSGSQPPMRMDISLPGHFA